MDTARLKELALGCGFTHAGPLDARTLRFLPEVREMCAADKCRSYGRSWSCPPACGTLEEISDRAGGYERGLIVQTVGGLDDPFDFEAMSELAVRHDGAFLSLLKQLGPEYPALLPMGAGACTLCGECSYPDGSCRRPEDMAPSMEAYGLLVSDVCTQNGMSYYHGAGTLAYTSCYLLE